MISGGLVLIRESLEHVKPSERNAAQYILENPEKVIHYSVQKLAEKSDSSVAAVMRLCKNLGFDGFKDLKIRIAGDLQIASAIYPEYSEIRPTDNIPDVMKALAKNNLSSITETFQSLDDNNVQKAVNALEAAARIDFYGAGASQLVAQDGQQKFSRIGYNCTAYPDGHLQITSAVTLKRGDVAVAVSYSGKTKQIISAARQAKEAGATLITLTKFGKNPLNMIGDINLSIVAKESDVRSAATSSRIVQLYIIDILYTGVAGANYKAVVKMLERSRIALKDQLDKG